MADKKPIDTTFQNSLRPEDREVMKLIANRMAELKKEINPVVGQVKQQQSEREKLGKTLRDMLLRYEDIPPSFVIGELPVSYTQGGEEYIDEQALLMAGVSKQIIEQCKRRKPGFFVVDRGSKGENK